MKDKKVTHFQLDPNKPIPGDYELDIYVNKQWRGKYNVNITDKPSETCLSAEIIANLGVLLPNSQTKQSTDCVPLREIIRSGSFAFD
ncbi:FimD/PapC N-terminal domain-containing protein, partial [Escherichia fergusonii]|uniref:FimD/PapC N-terminal domain-containing protein n=1 Tax=Escherichia fergusonii TaxID=564 RepID=UPI00285288BD